MVLVLYTPIKPLSRQVFYWQP